MSNKAVTIHIASMGTPLDNGEKSAVGHMWYELHDGHGNSSSYGFAPKVPGEAFGPGKVYKTDTEHYLDRKYMRTIEISDNQYNKMTYFGSNPSKFGFDEYNGVKNSCVDFTWEGLAYAGLKPEVFGISLPGLNYDGAVWPRNNIRPVKMIPGKDVPYPGKIDYMKHKKDTTWRDSRKGASQLGGSQQATLMAISNTPSFNYTSYKKDSIAGYSLYQFLDNAIDTVSTVSFNGQPAYVLTQTIQPTCMGDEAGIGGGIRSGTVGKEVKPTSASSSIFIAGKQLVREGDSCTMNNCNVIGKYIAV